MTASIAYEVILFAAVGYLIIGIDEIAIDLIWLGRSVWYLLVVDPKATPLSIERLPKKRDPDWFAVFVPTRNEAAVIGQML
jgi:adsorption protein B